MTIPLFLASSSPSRQKLLTDARIPYTLAGQSADESQCDWNLPLPQVVESIALHKMDHVLLPEGKEGQHCLVLTADTLSQDTYGTLTGKPTSYHEAATMIKAARNGMKTGTAFCLDRKVWDDGIWHVDKRIVEYVEASYHFVVPDTWIERYLTTSPALQTAGAITIEDVGFLFLSSVQGSFTTIVGLPMFELRVALETLGFTF